MKLVIVIVSNKDLTNVLSSTVEEGYFSTKISTQGMFLENGQTTVLFGVKDEDVEKLFDIIEKNVTKRVVRHIGVDSTLQGSLLRSRLTLRNTALLHLFLMLTNSESYNL